MTTEFHNSELRRVSKRVPVSRQPHFSDPSNSALAAAGRFSFPFRTRFGPILIFLAYLGLTVFLFLTGPLEFPIANPITLYVFLFLVHLALFLGYWNGLSSQPEGYRGRAKVSRLVWWSSLAALILFFPTSQFRTGNWIPDVAFGYYSPGMAYQDSGLLRESSQPLVEYIRIAAGPLLGMVLPLTVFYWSRLSWANRALGVAATLSTVALFIAMATNKALADTVLLVPILTFTAVLAGQLQLNKRKLILFAGVALVAFFCFLLFFSRSIVDRQGSAIRYNYFVATGGSVDTENIWIRHANETATEIIVGLDYYLAPGYYALSLSLQEPFIPMFGVGNSIFLNRQAARLLNDPSIEKMPYPFRIEKYGWSGLGLWSSIYPWIASDVSFPGVIVVVFLIGRLFALSWQDTLVGANPYAIVMFSQFVIMLLYFPANNQLVQSGEGFTAFWITLIFWLRSRKSIALSPPALAIANPGSGPSRRNSP